ncbi:MAG TPA: HlyD family secretion protein [Xanthobacteraceae bacterium]|nr:HlyD family secretion protein [Xanthobacteraceae bacterium]
MLKADQIERSNDQQLLADDIQPSKSPDLRKPELRIDRRDAPPRDAPPIAPAARNKPRGAIAALAERWSGSDHTQRIRWSMFALLPIAAAVGAYWYVTGGQVMSTDDAYVDADKVGVSTDVSGIVQDVDVRDNQHVAAGEILYRLDPRQFQIALDNAKANLAQTALTIDAMKQDYKRMLSDAAAEQAQVDLDQTNYNRESTLIRSGTVSQALFDQAQYTLFDDKNKLKSLQQQAATQLARLDGNADIETTQHPQYLQAEAQVDEARRQLDHTVVRAPFAGVVTNVPSIAPGRYLAASVTAFYLVAADHAWVEAEPKETQMTYVRPGQPVTVTVDTYPHVEWHGTVQSISPAGAQEFQLLPAQNTSGNWVKVVQRIPLRVRIDTSAGNMPPLRSGMSAEIGVDTGHARGLPHFLTALFDHSHGKVS